MKQRPMLFSQPMVQAIQQKRKTQTRRIVKKQPRRKPEPDRLDFDWASFFDCGHVHTWDEDGVGGQNWEHDPVSGEDKYSEALNRTPYKNPSPLKAGDRIWVKETHYLYGHWVKNGKTKTGKQAWKFKRSKRAQVNYYDEFPKHFIVKPSSYRNRAWYKRPSIFMTRKDSRITLEVTKVRVEQLQDISVEDALVEGIDHSTMACPRAEYFQLWNSINGDMAHEENPWVWVYEFKRMGG